MLRAYLHYSNKEYPLHYWRSYGGSEVDIFLETSKGFLAIELKSSAIWERKFNRGMFRLKDELGKENIKCLGVFLGERKAIVNGIEIFAGNAVSKAFAGRQNY